MVSPGTVTGAFVVLTWSLALRLPLGAKPGRLTVALAAKSAATPAELSCRLPLAPVI